MNFTENIKKKLSLVDKEAGRPGAGHSRRGHLEDMMQTKHVTIITLLVLLVFAGGTFLQGQERFMLNQEDAPKFRLAKQLFQSGQQYMVNEKYMNAEKAFTDCLKHFPKYSYADYALAQIYYQQKKYTLALIHIQNAKESYKFIAKLGAAAQTEYIMKLRDQKMKLSEDMQRNEDRFQFVKNHPTMSEEEKAAETINLRGHIRHSEQTITRIQERTLTPIAKGTDVPGGYYYVHGNVFFKVKRYKDALDQYLEAVKAEPTFGDAYNNIANLYFLARNYHKAMHYVNKAEKNGAEVHPNFKNDILVAIKKQQ